MENKLSYKGIVTELARLGKKALGIEIVEDKLKELVKEEEDKKLRNSAEPFLFKTNKYTLCVDSRVIKCYKCENVSEDTSDIDELEELNQEEVNLAEQKVLEYYKEHPESKPIYTGEANTLNAALRIARALNPSLNENENKNLSFKLNKNRILDITNTLKILVIQLEALNLDNSQVEAP